MNLNLEYLNYLGFEKLPNGYWSKVENLRHFMSYVSWKEGYKEADDWYKCSRQKLTKYGLTYNISISSILNKVYDTDYFIESKFYKELSNICIYNGCKIQPSYNYEGEKKGLYCKEHKLQDMIDVKSSTCIFVGCRKHPIYNYEGEKKRLYCKEHKLENMIDVMNNFCIFKECKIQSSYNYENEKKGIYCKEHKLENMINVMNSICNFIGCKITPNYNYENEKKGIYCKRHKLEDMIDVKSKKCKTPLCQTQVHKKYEGYCLYCYINTFPDKPITRNYKTKEKFVSDFICENFKDYKVIKDKRVDGGCSKRRPDILIDLGHRVIVIEIDENQHIAYDCSCENKRLMEIYQDVGLRPIVFIRFNPDDYINDKNENIESCWSPNSKGILQVNKNKEKEWNERLDNLKSQTQYWIENESDKAIETIQLYYDSNI